MTKFQIRCTGPDTYRVYQVFGYLWWRQTYWCSDHKSWLEAHSNVAVLAERARKNSEVGKVWITNSDGYWD